MVDATLSPSTNNVLAAPAEDEVNWTRVFLGFGGMVVGQFMAMLDIQIVAASLGQIQAGIGASADEMSWVQTIYLLAEVITIPLTAYLCKMWGTRPVYLVAAAAFIVSSIATGLSSSIDMMIITRALQGLAGGAMIPAVFATAMTVFPLERRVTANVIISLIVTMAPTVGPTLGGHITDWLDWRWLFFINVPPGLLVIFLVGRYGGFDKGDPKFAVGIDWWGLATMTVFLLSAQYVIEEGAREGWFDDDLILWLTVTAVITGVVFIWRQLTYRQPIVSLAPFTDRNFSLGLVMTVISAMALFGSMFLLPLLLSQVMGYNASQVGMTMLVSGVVMFATAPVGGQFVRRLDPRLPMIFGFGLTAYGMGLAVRVNPNWTYWDFAWMQGVRAFGAMVAMIATQQLTISTLPISMMKDASGLNNLIRNVGGAVGLAVVASILSHATATHLVDLSSLLSANDPHAQDLMNGMSGMMAERGAPDPDGAGRKLFGMMLHRNALLLGYNDAFMFLTICSLVAMVLSVFAKPMPAKALPADLEAH